MDKNDEMELQLFDRLEVIRAVLQNVPDDRAYISFSGGKDSTVLSHLIDEAIPNNKYDRVFINTGIEFNKIVDFVERERERDERIKIIKSCKNIRRMLQEDGYPFKSKFHSEMVERYQRSGMTSKSVQRYLECPGRSGRYNVPKCLEYQFSPDFKINVSQKCCTNLKKKPVHQYEKETGKTMAITGVRAGEGGVRAYHAETKGCVFRDQNGNIYKFNPLSPCTDEFIDWYIEKRKIKLCELYYPPYSFKRTGCKGCPYNVKVGKELNILKELLPGEYKQCWTIWKPVYEEYARIGYRGVQKDLEENEE